MFNLLYDESGDVNNLTLVGVGSLMFAFLFKFADIGAIEAAEREAHYKNAHTMATVVKKVIDGSISTLSQTKNKTDVLHDPDNADTATMWTKGELENVVGPYTIYTLKKLAIVDKLIVVTDDPTHSRIEREVTAYDTSQSLVRVGYCKADGECRPNLETGALPAAITEEATEATDVVQELIFSVNLVGTAYTADTKYTFEPYAIGASWYYILGTQIIAADIGDISYTNTVAATPALAGAADTEEGIYVSQVARDGDDFQFQSMLDEDLIPDSLMVRLPQKNPN